MSGIIVFVSKRAQFFRSSCLPYYDSSRIVGYGIIASEIFSFMGFFTIKSATEGGYRLKMHTILRILYILKMLYGIVSVGSTTVMS